MSVNPVVLIQMLMNYHQMEEQKTKDPRAFVFQRNNLLRVHRETKDEVERRKSNLSSNTVRIAKNAIRTRLSQTLHGRCGKVWIDPYLEHLAVPLETATGNSGYGVLPTGSRIQIPKGKVVRAFTYWEKVNDIDLSCFGLTEDGRQDEFSWRTMWGRQGAEITYSGDETSGHRGGSEYFDIDFDQFKVRHPQTRYLIFCNNVFSRVPFKDVVCKAGFMLREEVQSGEIYEPKTVQTSFQITADSTFGYLFAIDMETREMIWLNVARAGQTPVAGSTSMAWLKKYLTMTEIFSLKDLYAMAGEIVDDPLEAEILVTDRPILGIRENQETIRSWDFEKMLELLKAG
jgi:hypothetical protein